MAGEFCLIVGLVDWLVGSVIADLDGHLCNVIARSAATRQSPLVIPGRAEGSLTGNPGDWLRIMKKETKQIKTKHWIPACARMTK